MRHDDRDWDTEHRIGEDVRNILNGLDVRDRRNQEPDPRDIGPQILPGMEDAGIGSSYREQDYLPPAQNLEYDFGMTGFFPEEQAYEEGLRDDGGSKKKHGRLPYLLITYSFILIFLLMIGHLVYFNLRLKDDILNSPYNKRQNAQEEYILRGNITSRDGRILARTETDGAGNYWRTYPYEREYAHVVGYVTHGKSGIESIANYQLMSAHNNLIDQITNDFLNRKNPGDTVVSTLDSRLQDVCYQVLDGYRGAVVVLDKNTGAILAMVSKPDFNPNTLASEWDDMVADSSNSQLLNRATQGLYPPGSTFKMVTALAYYRQHHSFDGFQYNCTGEFPVGNITVHCYKGNVHGEEDFTRAFANSCNTAFSQIGLGLGAGRLKDAAESLLFGERAYCVLHASRSSWTLTENDGEAELVQTAFGQGKTLTTPYHMAMICQAVASDGVMMKPYLIDHVENDGGSTLRVTKPSVYRRVMSAEEAAALRGLMEKVVSEGTASSLSGRGYLAGGKTGSAEYIKADGETGTHSWFVGYTDFNGEGIVTAVLAEDGGAGSTTAVPAASRIFDTWYETVRG